MKPLILAFNIYEKEVIVADDEFNSGHAKLASVRRPSGILH